MIKLSAELVTSTGRDFDTTIKLNTSMAEKYFDLQNWFTLHRFSLFSREQQAIVGSLR